MYVLYKKRLSPPSLLARVESSLVSHDDSDSAVVAVEKNSKILQKLKRGGASQHPWRWPRGWRRRHNAHRRYRPWRSRTFQSST